MVKFGIANLLSKNSQIDFNVGGSLKDTPTYSYFDLGFSFRFDWHKDIVNFKSVSKEEINDLKQKKKRNQ